MTAPSRHVYWMANLRKRPWINYRELASGPSLRYNSVKPETWSSSILYPLTVLDSKLEDGILKVFVHYTGWQKKYDEWRDAADVIDIPAEFLSSDEAAKKLFYKNLQFVIKELLHGQRKVNSFVELRLAVVKDIFEDLSRFAQPHPSKKRNCYCEQLSGLQSSSRVPVVLPYI